MTFGFTRDTSCGLMMKILGLFVLSDLFYVTWNYCVLTSHSFAFLKQGRQIPTVTWRPSRCSLTCPRGAFVKVTLGNGHNKSAWLGWVNLMLWVKISFLTSYVTLQVSITTSLRNFKQPDVDGLDEVPWQNKDIWRPVIVNRLYKHQENISYFVFSQISSDYRQWTHEHQCN